MSDAAAARAKRVSEPLAPTVRLPLDGDVVVSWKPRSAVRYTVRQFPGVVQFSASSREEAVRIARGFAQRYAIDLWGWAEGIYRLLEKYRR